MTDQHCSSNEQDPTAEVDNSISGCLMSILIAGALGFFCTHLSKKSPVPSPQHLAPVPVEHF